MLGSVIYPGTFDPITNGHLDIIRRAAPIFPKLIVAIAKNASKKPWLSWQARIACTTEAVASLQSVVVMGFDALLVDFARQQQASVILRGLRAVVDFEYECQLAGMNRKLSPQIETIFLSPSPESLCISSTLVREIASMGGDISPFVPPAVLRVYEQSLTK